MTRQPSPAAMLQPGPLEQELRLAGYTEAYNDVDAQTCAEVECDCGAPRSRYIGLQKDESYRSISHCDVCGLEVEF